MSGWTLAEIAELCAGTLENAPAAPKICPYGAIGIDTRSLQAGSLFIAIRAARDGHAYLADAHARGAIAALVDTRPGLKVPPDLPLIRVADPLASLQRWAGTHRKAMPAEVIAVTGSSGKTTTKDRIAEILASDRPTHRTTGNLNNQLGVPLPDTGTSMRDRRGWNESSGRDRSSCRALPSRPRRADVHRVSAHRRLRFT